MQDLLDVCFGWEWYIFGYIFFSDDDDNGDNFIIVMIIMFIDDDVDDDDYDGHGEDGVDEGDMNGWWEEGKSHDVTTRGWFGLPKSREMIEIEQPKESCSHDVLQWM